jgi:hypothetical protein
MWLIMDISFVLDGWSHTQNPGRFPADQASGSQQPPPPPPNLAKVMARQTELLNLLVQAQQNHQRQQSRGGRDDPKVENYQDFFSTQPPLFSKVEEPLDADAWLCTIESKFALLTIPYVDSNKAHFAAQQLRGVARIWWDNCYAM